MAYVKILNLKSRGAIKNASLYVENEKKTSAEQWGETVSGVQTGSENRSIGEAIDNVSKEAGKERLVTGINCLPPIAAEQMQQTADYWKTVKERRGVTRDAFHVIQSFDPKDNGFLTPELAHKIGIDFSRSLQRMHDKKDIDASYRMLVCTHVDKGHLHNHIVMCSYDLETGAMFHECKEVYRQMKESSDRLCRENGLSVIEEPDTGRRRSRTEYEAAQNGTSWKENLRRNIEAFASVSEDFGEFKSNMESAGYLLRVGQYVTYEDPEGHRVRDKTLGRAWTRVFLEKGWSEVMPSVEDKDDLLENDPAERSMRQFYGKSSSVAERVSAYKKDWYEAFSASGNAFAANLEAAAAVLSDNIASAETSEEKKRRLKIIKDAADTSMAYDVSSPSALMDNLSSAEKTCSCAIADYNAFAASEDAGGEVAEAVRKIKALRPIISGIEAMPDGEAKEESALASRAGDIAAFMAAKEVLARSGRQADDEALTAHASEEGFNAETKEDLINDLTEDFRVLKDLIGIKRAALLAADEAFLSGEQFKEPFFKEENTLKKAEMILHNAKYAPALEESER